ncbi:MAG: hypothetical protein LRY33_04275 [Parabacteroides chartae]|nr:hypothetical protein [Parabacteroides chartae]
MKTKNLIGIQLLFLILVCFVSCDKDEDTKELTPQALYQTSWSGAGYCESWTSKSKNIGIQFVDTQKGSLIGKITMLSILPFLLKENTSHLTAMHCIWEVRPG